MNRNTELHFANLPSVNIGRSKFDRSFTHKTTFNAGKLIPIYVDATIMPGDTVKMGLSEVVRMMTPICPVMDNAYMDVYFFFVPHRLTWPSFPKFMGENKGAPWASTYSGKIPQLIAPNSVKSPKSVIGSTEGWNKGSIADYFGIPTGITNFSVNRLPFAAYSMVWTEFFRDENIQYPEGRNADENASINGTQAGADREIENPRFQGLYGGTPLPVCKLHDYFTSCLPNTQKGEPVKFAIIDDKQYVKFDNTYNTGDNKPEQGLDVQAAFSDETIGGATKTIGNFTAYQDENTNVSIPDGNWDRMYVDLSAATGTTVNQLRQAFAIQKFMERDARNGTRFIEVIKSHFNVTNPDYRLARPEYLGGKRIPINMNTVVQNSPTVSDATTPLGTTGAYSVTSDSDNDLFTKSFTEWGTLLGLVCIRTDRTYQQGLNKQWSIYEKYDFYFPEFANLGEEAVLNKEIYLQGQDDNHKNPDTGNYYDNEAFGYQERYANYRYMPDYVSGELRSNYAQSLDIWHYADYYTEMPTLTDDWLQEDDSNIERTLAIQSHDQFIGDFFFKAIYTRPMPLYSVPGLIDHH